MRLLSRSTIKIVCKTFVFLSAIISIAFVLIFSSSCSFVHLRDYYTIEKYPNTSWSTNDGKITFSVGDEWVKRYEGSGDVSYVRIYTKIFGQIDNGEVKQNVFITFPGTILNMRIMSDDMPKDGEEGEFDNDLSTYTIANFKISYISNKHFKATVTDSPIYEVGTVFDFYRTDN